MRQHSSSVLNDIIHTIDQLGTQRESIYASNSTMPIMLPSLSQESLISSAREASHQTTKTLIRRRNQQSRLSLYTRKSEATPITIRSHNPEINQWEQFYVEAITSDDSLQAYNSLTNIMMIAVEQDNLRFLIRLFRLASLTLIHYKEYGKALIFLKNSIFLSEFMRDLETIQWALLQMGVICKHVQKFEIGKVFMKKSIEFAWYMESLDEELHCYEEMGKLCFMNYELQLAKQLHDMSMAGKSPNDGILKISRRGIDQLIHNYPEQQSAINQQILSKIIDFPFVIKGCQEAKLIKNQYLSKHHLECVKVDRLYPTCLEEILNKILQDHHFFFEIPMPLENAIKQDKPISRRERIKSTQMITWIKLAIQKQQGQEAKPIILPHYPPPLENKKITLDQAVTERLKTKIMNSKDIFQQIQCVKRRNMECIRLTHEKHTSQHGESRKKDLLKYAQECLCNKNSNFSLLL